VIESRWWRTPRRNLRDDTGGALVEFIAISLLLLVPVVYLVVTVGRVQSGLFAAEATAQEAARVVVVEGVRALEDGDSHAQALDQGAARAESVAAVTMNDFGFDLDDTTVTFECSESPCLSLGGNVTALVEVRVALPGVPGFVGSRIPLEVTVSGYSRAPVDGLAADS
jgi:hypothetical protein